jgi:hypothetical protein
MAKCNTDRVPNCPTPSNYSDCRPWDLTESGDSCFIENQLIQAVEIAGARINIYKLLGVHEQNALLDVTGLGTPISGGDHPSFPAKNAYTTFDTKWTSRQSGDAVAASAYLGYDFGVVKLTSGRRKYAVPAAVRYNIATIRIKQSPIESERVTKARVERSDNGTEWYGVAIINLPNTSNLETISFKQTVPSRYWRLRPVQFAGPTCTSWTVFALEMHEYDQTSLQNIEDKILFENRNRDYDQTVRTLKGYYDLISPFSLLMKTGFSVGATSWSIKIPFATAVATLNRPIIIGDILELPSEIQYSPTLQPIKKYLEVTDVTWDATTYTPGWQPLMLLITARPAFASQETQDIFGDLTKHVDTSGLFSTDDGNSTAYQDFTAISHTIRNQALTEVPELGSEGSNSVREFTEEEIAEAAPIGNLKKLNFNRTQLYVEDGLPQNGEPFTEGVAFPQNPSNLDYHRLTYDGSASDVPARLYRYSTAKGTWVYLESDKRQVYNSTKPTLQEYLASPTRKSPREV